MEWKRMINLGFELVFQLYVWPYGYAGLILFLTKGTVLFFCRLSAELCIGYSFGSAFSRRIGGGYGYWVQPAADGYSGLLFPVYWMAVH
jgi:hypothetical protein